MKIVLPYYQFKIDDTIVVGGRENFIQKIHQEYDNIILVDLNPTILKNKSNSNREIIKQCNQTIKRIALDNEADIIISNWQSAVISGAGMVDSPIPILHIDHTVSRMLSCIPSFLRLKKYNHSVFLVNPYQTNYYDSYSKRINLPKVNFDGYVEPAFLDGVKPKLFDEPEFDCVTIGRCSPSDKMPFKLKIMLKDTNFKTLLMTNIPTDAHKKLWGDDKFFKRCHNYYQKNKHWEDCLYDLPHNEVMKNLCRAKTFFMTWEDECFPIVGLEALSCGIPLILNSRMTEERDPVKKQNFKYPLHGGEKWAVKETHYINIKLNSNEELISAINKLKNIDRQEVQDMTWEKYTKKRWKSLLDNAIDKTIENFNQGRKKLLI